MEKYSLTWVLICTRYIKPRLKTFSAVLAGNLCAVLHRHRNSQFCLEMSEDAYILSIAISVTSILNRKHCNITYLRPYCKLYFYCFFTVNCISFHYLMSFFKAV